jgi:ribonuclease HII
VATLSDRRDRLSLVEDLDRYERTLRAQGFARVAGVDEAGRGALAGPLVAAAVVLPEGFDRTGIRDSKQLSAKQRAEQYRRIVATCHVSVCRESPQGIDRRGLHRCNLALLRRAAALLDPPPDYVLTDGFPVPRMTLPSLAIKKGDMVTASIAAASIVAKVTRDRIMDVLHRRFPEFGFDANRGYGTQEHLAVLDRVGPSRVHRLSFTCVGQAALPGLSRSGAITA